VPVHRRWLRTAAIGAATLVAAVLVVAIGFSSDDLPRARAATELDRSPPDPRPSPSPIRKPADDDPAMPTGTAVEPAPGPSQPAGPAAGAHRPQSAAPSEEPRPAATTPPPKPHTRPRSPAPSASQIGATRDSGHGRPAGRSRARVAQPLTYDPNALFLDKR
jgi:type IV secretory pathway VirB10-like protein